MELPVDLQCRGIQAAFLTFTASQKVSARQIKCQRDKKKRKLLSGILKGKKKIKRPTHIRSKSHKITKSDKIKLAAQLKLLFNAVISKDDIQSMK